MFVNFKVGEVSDAEIVSPKTVTFVNKEETEKQKELVLSQVQEVYELDPTISKKQVENVKTFFDSLVLHKKELEEIQVNVVDKKENEGIETTEEVIEKSPKVKIQNIYEFSEQELEMFIQTNNEDLQKMKEVFAKQVENVYTSGITEEKLPDIREEFENITIFSLFDEKIRTTFLSKLTPTFKANFTLNIEETEKRKKEALNSVQSILETIQSGVKIVGKNEIIEDEHIKIMKEVGIITEDFDIKQAMKRFPFVFMMLFGLHLFLYKFSSKDIQNQRLYLFVFFMTFIVTVMANFFQNAYFTYTLFVVALMAITTFLSPSVSILYAIVLSMLIYTGQYSYLFLAIVLGIVQTIGHNPEGDRSTILNLGVIMGTVSVLGYLVLSLVLGQPVIISDVYPLFLSPIIASMFVIGAFKYLESMLGLITSLKLHELDGSKHKLIKRLINEAPGTFHHSVRVGQLAEAAANEIGANGLLLKVGALYHDVGKLENPKHFIENITKDEKNPHDLLEPKQSAAYILQHPIDSVKLCRKYRIPEQIIQLIEKHHGDSSVEYFYIKQKEIDGDEVNINDFKYRTSPPQTKEEGILMLADVTEAVSRTLNSEDSEEFGKKIEQLIYKKVEEGQLRKCELTMKEIGIIIDSFISNLLPANHQRIKYPEEK